MSRVVPPSGEPVPPTPRRSFTPAQRKMVFDRQNGLCAATGEPLAGLDWQIDHVLPLELGGRHEPSNWEGVTREAHKRKTARDRRAIAKAARLRKKATEPKAVKLKGRGWNKLLSRRMNGEVVRKTP